MKTRHIPLIIFTILFTMLTSRSVVLAQDQSIEETAGSSPFTYQGQVLQNGEPVDGACDFQFSLWDAASAGNQIGSLRTITNVPVTNGIFAGILYFGAARLIPHQLFISGLMHSLGRCSGALSGGADITTSGRLLP